VSIAPIPMTLAEAAVEIAGIAGLDSRQSRAVTVAMRTAQRARTSSTSQVNTIADLIFARDAQRSALDAIDRAFADLILARDAQRGALDALDRAIGTATTVDV